jgi:mxaC protein
MNFDLPWALLLLPLVALPFLAPTGPALANAWAALSPRDRWSDGLGWALRGLAALAVVALVVAIAGPYRPETTVERVGQGAEIVLVLDRSRSMDQGFAPGAARPAAARGNGPEALDHYFSQTPGRLRESKGQAARRLLSAFAASRSGDRFALIAFSTRPMRILDFTDKAEVVQAAIAAGNIGRGLSETNIALALEAAMGMFDDRPYTGSRLIMLISDGGDQIDPDTRERLAHLAQLHRVGINWLYLRSANSPALSAAEGDAAGAADNVAELQLHRWFGSLTTPYRAYEAGDSQALQRAIADVDRLERLPIITVETVPRRDLVPWADGAALAAVLLLLAARLAEIRRWA